MKGNIVWNNITEVPAPEGVAIWTKIDDHLGCRNEQQLIRKGNL